MKQIFAFESAVEYDGNADIIQRFTNRLTGYQKILEQNYALTDAPKGIVWTSSELATNTFSDIPIPAYTNKDLIYISPDLMAWRKLMVEQLDGKNLPNIQQFYENFSENHLFTILAHELTHHSDLFMDDFEDERPDAIWFEEGMCQYLPRKLLLSEQEFEEITAIELKLVEVYTKEYGSRSINEFGSSSYLQSLSSIMFDYWRSFLAIKFLVEERFQHDINSVFGEYHRWNEEGRKMPLTAHFGLNEKK